MANNVAASDYISQCAYHFDALNKTTNITTSKKQHQQQCSDLEDGEVFKDTVHHVLLWQMLQLMYEVDEIFTHRRSFNSVDKVTAFTLRVLRLTTQHTITDSNITISTTT